MNNINIRGKGSSTDSSKFIDLMVRTGLFLLKHVILQKRIANCGTKVLNLLMQLEVEKSLAISEPRAFFFFALNGDKKISISDI